MERHPGHRLPRLTQRGLRFLAFVIVVLAAGFYVNQNAEDSAQTNYENQMAGCLRNNPVREAVATAVATAAETTTNPDAAPRYEEALEKLLAPANVEPNGSVDCEAAIQKP